MIMKVHVNALINRSIKALTLKIYPVLMLPAWDQRGHIQIIVGNELIKKGLEGLEGLEGWLLGVSLLRMHDLVQQRCPYLLHLGYNESFCPLWLIRFMMSRLHPAYHWAVCGRNSFWTVKDSVQ